DKGTEGNRGHRSRSATETRRHRVRFCSVPPGFRGFLVSVTFVAFVSSSPRAQSQPASLLGRISFPTSGSASAQPEFVRGVLLLHSFEYDDAIVAFRQAQKADPGFAMAYWGEALSYNQPLWLNENLDKARGVLDRLRAVQRPGQTQSQFRGPAPLTAPTPREQGYIEAVERLFGAGD